MDAQSHTPVHTAVRTSLLLSSNAGARVVGLALPVLPRCGSEPW